MTRVIVAEKPSLARAIAAGIDGPRQSFDGYIRVGDTIITHCFGHLYELADPGSYNPEWKKWSLETLPITLQRDRWRLIPRPDAKAQIGVIAKLLSNAKSVVNAGDPDREGQMLVDELLEELGWTGPTQRLLLHDTTPASVRKALASMKPNVEFAALYEAAKCRARADWLVGMNLTRAASQKMGLTASMGRVQTPALALVVRRDLAIEGHTSSAFYTLAADAANGYDTITLTHDTEHDRITDKALADGLAARLKGQTVNVSVTEKTITENAPMPHKLATFQKEAEARFGWTVAKALKALQAAYEQQLVSYPRTDCAYLPEEQARLAVPSVVRILGAGHFPQVKPLAAHLAPSGRVYDDKKVEQHHGLTPTSRLPDAGTPATDDAYRAWLIVTEQFIKSLLPAYRATVKEASFIFEGRLFKATGEEPTNLAQSWRALEPKKGRDGEPILPLRTALGHGQSAPSRVTAVAVKQGKTTPPKPYTEATLVADMSAVHKFVDDPKIKGLLKENAGIGTPATQGSIIETLKQRGYLELTTMGRGKKLYLRSTRFGRYLIANMPRVLSDPGVTALWEEQLNAIAAGGASAEDFMARIDKYIAGNVARIVGTTFPDIPESDRPKKPAAKTGTRAARPAARKPVARGA